MTKWVIRAWLPCGQLVSDEYYCQYPALALSTFQEQHIDNADSWTSIDIDRVEDDEE